MEEFAVLLNNILLIVASVLFIQDSVILFIRGRYSRAKRMLGITTLLWGLMYVVYLVSSLQGWVDYPIFSGGALISSHVFILIMFLFPLEILAPGWMSGKRLLLALTPITILALIYWGGLKLTGQTIEHFYSFSDFWASVGKFNVWYRFILLGCNLLFLYILVRMLKSRELKYIRWQNDNYSDLDSVDISWLHSYWHIMRAIIVCYLVVSIWGVIWSIIVHTVIVIGCFTFMAYKGIFYQDSYPEYLSEAADENCLFGMDNNGLMMDKPYDENSFNPKLPEYVQALKKWMDEEKPYLHKDFKLRDVGRILPLNRSYLSRVFNEGFQQSFSEVIRQYRIEYAKTVLDEFPDLTLYKVAERCGFTSDTTFIRAFQKVTGLTPRQYKMKN